MNMESFETESLFGSPSKHRYTKMQIISPLNYGEKIHLSEFEGDENVWVQIDEERIILHNVREWHTHCEQLVNDFINRITQNDKDDFKRRQELLRSFYLCFHYNMPNYDVPNYKTPNLAEENLQESVKKYQELYQYLYDNGIELTHYCTLRRQFIEDLMAKYEKDLKFLDKIDFIIDSLKQPDEAISA